MNQYRREKYFLLLGSQLCDHRFLYTGIMRRFIYFFYFLLEECFLKYKRTVYLLIHSLLFMQIHSSKDFTTNTEKASRALTVHKVYLWNKESVEPVTYNKKNMQQKGKQILLFQDIILMIYLKYRNLSLNRLSRLEHQGPFIPV